MLVYTAQGCLVFLSTPPGIHTYIKVGACACACVCVCARMRMRMRMHACIHGCMDAWMHGCMDAWMDGWMDGRHKCMHGCVCVCLCRYIQHIYICIKNVCMHTFSSMPNSTISQQLGPDNPTPT